MNCLPGIARSTAAALVLAANTHAASVEIRVDCARPTVSLSPHFYGLFFEDINYAADGGLYAELVQNRSFEYHSLKKTHPETDFHPLFGWEMVERGGARVAPSVADAHPLHANNPHYLELKIAPAGEGGVRNGGFFGIHTDAGARYDVSLFARTADWSGGSALTATLEDAQGTACGSVVLTGAGASWKKLEGVLVADQTVDNARLVVTTKGEGTLHLDMVSLFPRDTFKGRRNGLRKDLVQALADLDPQFLRFPGGCIAHGWGLENMYRWKDSVGPLEKRKANWNLWGYFQTYGLGYFEYFQLCEDLDMTPLPVIPIGVGCGFRCNEFVPIDELGPHIQDALDLIEFAKGSATSKWGAVRAGMGHPEPFALEFVCLGNEEHDTPGMRERFPLFSKAIREAYPEVKIIGTSGLGPDLPTYDLMAADQVYSSDEHYYEDPEWFLRNQHRFDDFDRHKPKIFIGEYASKGNTMFNALAEAAYLTGAERNGDIVDMTCYAPLLARNDVGGWRPDLIFFSKRDVLLTPNYHVQQMFARNKGDVYLANTFAVKDASPATTQSGRIGIGSWTSAIEVQHLAVNGRKIDPSSWKNTGGNFAMKDGSLIQSDAGAAPAMSLSTESYSGKTVTYEIRARRTAGDEGFLVRFGADPDGTNGFWWNIGGWGNTRHALEQFNGRNHGAILNARGSITPGQWYDIKVELAPGVIRCSLDGKLIHESRSDPAPLSVASTFDRASGEVILKLVNPSPDPVTAHITLAGAKAVAAKARLISLSGGKAAVNTFENPETVKPITREIPAGSEFTHTIPAMAVEFIRVKKK